MIQPISGPPPGQPPGQGDNLPSGAGNQPLSSQQRTSLESLMTKVTSLTQQQRAELWAGIRHDIGLSGDSPLLSRHFPAAEHNLAQRLLAAQKSHSARQLLAQLGEYLRLGNNRQAVTDYIRHNFGQTPLNQLSPEQLKTILTLLQEGKMVIPQPQQREATDRPSVITGGAQCAQTAGDQTCGGNGRTQQADLAIDAGTFRGERWRVNSSETV